MGRNKHPSKEIERAIQFAESSNWRYKESGNSAHSWGRLLCPFEGREGCSMSIWSTPKIVEVHAKQIRERVKTCPHKHIGLHL